MNTMTSTEGPSRRQVRATAAVSTSVLAVAAGSVFADLAVAAVLLAFQFMVFTLGWVNPGRHPYRGMARAIESRFGDQDREHPLPVRFASLVGSIVTFLAFAGTVTGAAVIAFGFALVAMLATGANAFGGWCAACAIYPRVRRFVDPLLTTLGQPRHL